MYSLVSASVLGFDLTRLPGGEAVAEVLLRALTLRADDLPVLAAQLPAADDRAGLWADVQRAASQVPTVRDVGVGELTIGTLAGIRRAPIGTVDGLLTCLRHDILSWTWIGAGRTARQAPDAAAATSVLCDAAVAGYLRDLLSVDARRRLAAPWVRARRKLADPPPVDLGPHHGAVDGLLGQVRAMPPSAARRLSRAVDEYRRSDPNGWAASVHSASWAAYLSDRVRTAAAAQLLLVQALDTSAVSAHDRAAGVWNLLSGAAQALVVRDLLDTQAAHRLVAPVLSVFGPAWLPEPRDNRM
ncbi:hypothetical protein [Pilimelia columellifera]|uniref:Uncharacterized protein n=1 Tax=Pilimelia columellifera subsp. columellifera TaxID=706583 RepID=A0ABN3N7L6_9ACTN